jgi:dTDP-4-dehydrorhamnose reductase
VLFVKVLVTGAGGQVGRALVASAPGHVKIVRCSHADLDVADLDSVLRCIREHAPDVIINAAAYTAVDRAECEPDWARRVNTDGPRYLALAAREVGARLVHLSTDFVFDGTSRVPYPPTAPTNPLNVYGLTKRDGEEAVLDILPESSIVLRTAWVYAAEGHNFVRTMLRLMRANGSVRVVRDQVGTPTAARSIAEIIWRLTENPAFRGTHHWTDAGVASWYDFAVAIAEEASHLDMVSPSVTVLPIATDEYPTPARRPAYSVLDTRSLASLGLLPEHWRKRLRSILGDIKNA